MLMEQSLNTTQDQLSQRVTEVVRHEQINRKLQAELKTLRERNTSYEEEIAEQKGIIDKLRKDLMGAKEEYHSAVQEGLAYKQQAHKTEVELKGAREQEQMLTEQVSRSNTDQWAEAEGFNVDHVKAVPFTKLYIFDLMNKDLNKICVLTDIARQIKTRHVLSCVRYPM